MLARDAEERRAELRPAAARLLVPDGLAERRDQVLRLRPRGALALGGLLLLLGGPDRAQVLVEGVGVEDVPVGEPPKERVALGREHSLDQLEAREAELGGPPAGASLGVGGV